MNNKIIFTEDGYVYDIDDVYNLYLENKQLKSQLQEKEKIIEDAIEYIRNWQIDFYEYECDKLILSKNDMNNLLEILERK